MESRDTNMDAKLLKLMTCISLLELKIDMLANRVKDKDLAEVNKMYNSKLTEQLTELENLIYKK